MPRGGRSPARRERGGASRPRRGRTCPARRRSAAASGHAGAPADDAQLVLEVELDGVDPLLGEQPRARLLAARRAPRRRRSRARRARDLRGSRGAVPTLSLLSVTLPARRRGRCSDDRSLRRAARREPRSGRCSSSGASLPFTRSREPARRRRATVYCSPRRASSEPFVTRITGARVSTVNVQLARASEQAAARRRHVDRVLAVGQSPRPEHDPAVACASTPSRHRPAVERPRRGREVALVARDGERERGQTALGRRVADRGPVGVEPAGSAAESERTRPDPTQAAPPATMNSARRLRAACASRA